MMNYEVGQIIYIVLNRSRTVAPMLVTEEVKKKTLEGEQVSYVVQHNATIKPLDDVDGEIFLTLDDVRTTLLDRATQAIHHMLESVERQAHTQFPEGKEVKKIRRKQRTAVTPGEQASEEEDPRVKDDVAPRNTPGYDLVTMPDGSVARVKLPEF